MNLKTRNENQIDLEVARHLKLYRTSKNLSQQEIGKVIGVSIQQIQKYEKSTNRISSGNLYKIAKYLEIPINAFFPDQEVSLLNLNKQNSYNSDLLICKKALNRIKDPRIKGLLFNLVEYLLIGG